MYDVFSLRGILIIILVFFSIIATFIKPKYGLIAFIVLLFARDGFFIAWFPLLYTKWHLPLFFGVITVISWIINIEHYPFKFPFQMWLLVAFFLIVTFSRAVAGADIIDKFTEDFLKMCILVFLIINLVRNFEDLKQVLWVLVLVNVFMVLFHYYDYKTGWTSIFVVTSYRGLDRNGFAAVLASLVGLDYFLMKVVKHKFLKFFLLFCFLVFIGGIILTYSRAGALSLFLVLFLCIVMDKRYRTRAIILFLLGSMILGVRISDKYFERMRTIKEYHKDPSAMGRIATNYAALNIMKEYPLLGVGARNFPEVLMDYIPHEHGGYVHPQKNIHNIILQIGSETGLIALLFFSLLIGNVFFESIKIRKNIFKKDGYSDSYYLVAAAGVSLWVYFFGLQFIPWNYYGYLYIFIGLSMAANQISKNNDLKF